ncbi:MAG: tetratricopeptide repeat protein [Kiritimatiellia bacterium]
MKSIHCKLMAGLVVASLMAAGCAAPPPVTVTRPGGHIKTKTNLIKTNPDGATASFAKSPGAVQRPAAAVLPQPPPGLSAIQTAKMKAAADPLNWRCYNELGLVYSKAKMYDEAIAAFEQALALHPVTTTVESEKKQQQSMDAQREAILQQQQRQQAAQNSAATSQLLLGLMGSMASLPGADPQMMAVLPTVNNIMSAGDQMAITAATGVDIPKTMLESQLKPKREVAGIYFNLGAAQYGKGIYAQAILSLDNSLSLDPSRVEALWWVAEAYFRQASYQKAITTMNRYLALGSASPAPSCFIRLSESFRALGLDKEADKAFLAAVNEHKSLIAADPDGVEPALELARAYMGQDRYAEAEELIVKLLETQGSDGMRLDLAAAQLCQSRFAEALQSVQKVANGKSDDNQIYAGYLAARANDELGSPDEALKAYRQTAQLLDNLPMGSIMPTFGPVVLAAVGRYGEARKESEFRLAKDPFGMEAPMDLFRLGLVYEKGGQDVEAMEALNRALLLRPRYSLASAVLRRLEKKNAAACEKALAEADAAVGRKDLGVAVRQLSNAFQLMAASPKKRQVHQRILQLTAEMEAPPPLTPEAQRHYLRGNAALKAAKETIDLDRAISEYRWATLYSPWAAPIYLNSAAAYGVRLRYAEATEAIKLYLVASPKAKNVEDLLNKLAELEYQQEENLRSLSF